MFPDNGLSDTPSEPAPELLTLQTIKAEPMDAVSLAMDESGIPQQSAETQEPGFNWMPSPEDSYLTLPIVTMTPIHPNWVSKKRKRGDPSLSEQGLSGEDIRKRKLEQNRLAAKRRRIRIKAQIQIKYLIEDNFWRLISVEKLTVLVDMLEKLRDDNFDGSHRPHIDYILAVLQSM